MLFQDYYQILEVDPSATEAEIKAATARELRRYSPDEDKRSEQDKNNVNALTHAYIILKNARSEYNVKWAKETGRKIPVIPTSQESPVFKDYYKVLGIEPSASEAEIKAVANQNMDKYREDGHKLSIKEEAKAADIKAAFYILLTLRSEYDSEWVKQTARKQFIKDTGQEPPELDSEGNYIDSSRPQRKFKYAADFDDNPPYDNEPVDEEAVAKNPQYSNQEMLHAVTKWLMWHKKTTIALGVILLLILVHL